MLSDDFADVFTDWGLSDCAKAILSAATDTPQPSKQLIRKAGYQVGSYARQTITDLVRSGRLLRTPDGLRRNPYIAKGNNPRLTTTQGHPVANNVIYIGWYYAVPTA
jgi:hypothetical protein